MNHIDDRGDWMQTFTGRAFHPLDPRPEDISPLDIAHGLAYQCRYNGHTRRFYSVAEHCVLMSYAVAPEFALWALLHDATEAYVGDVVRPLKRYLPAYVEIEDRLMSVIAERFGLSPAGPTMPPEVKEADNRILVNERAALLGPPPKPWGYEHLEPLPVEIQGWSPEWAEREYYQRLLALTGVVVRIEPFSWTRADSHVKTELTSFLPGDGPVSPWHEALSLAHYSRNGLIR